MYKEKIKELEDAMKSLQEAIQRLKREGNDTSGYDGRRLSSYDAGRLTADVRRKSMELTHVLADFRNPQK